MRFFYWLAYYTARARLEWARGARDGFSPPAGDGTRRRDGFSPPAGDGTRRILEILRDDSHKNYVLAIKTHRELFNTSLKEAKDAVDALINKNGIK